MVFPLTGIPGTSAAELPPHGLFIMLGRRGAAGMPLLSVRVVWVYVCKGGEKVYDEAFPRQRCQTERRSLFDGAAGSHETVCLCRSECVEVYVHQILMVPKNKLRRRQLGSEHFFLAFSMLWHHSQHHHQQQQQKQPIGAWFLLSHPPQFIHKKNRKKKTEKKQLCASHRGGGGIEGRGQSESVINEANTHRQTSSHLAIHTQVCT